MTRLASAAMAVLVVLGAGPARADSKTVVLKPDELKTMSLDSMQTSGDSAVQEMNELVKQVLDSLADAQKRKDFARMNCLGDVITTIKGLLRLSEQNGLSLREKVINRDRPGAEHEYVKLTIARNKVIELHAQAKGCGGPEGEMMFEGAPRVDRTVDSDLPLEDSRTGLDRPAIVIQPPPSASPYY